MRLLHWGPDRAPGPWVFRLVGAEALGRCVVPSMRRFRPRGTVQTYRRQVLLSGTSPTGTSETQRPEAGAAAANTAPLPTAPSGNPSSSPLRLPRSNPPGASPLPPDSWPQSACCRLHTPLTPSRGPRGMNHFALSRFYFSCFKKSTYSSYYSEDEKKKVASFFGLEGG